jgi:hypothetical protein
MVRLQRSQQMHKPRLTRLWCFIALGSMLVFGGDPQGQSGTEAWGQPILQLVDGIDAPEKLPGIGQYFDIQSHVVCTATLILPDIALTAAHCVSFKSGFRPSSFTFTDANNQKHQRLVSRVHVFSPEMVPDPTVYNADDLPGVAGNNDIAIVQLGSRNKLSDPIPADQATPLTIADDQPRLDMYVTEFGFGCTGDGRPSGIKRYWTWRYGPPANKGCNGDSGGPAIFGKVEHDQGGDIWGVISGSNDDVFGNVVWFKEQILDVIRGWRNETVDQGVDRPGLDFLAVDGVPDASWCLNICQADSRCRAFSYVPSQMRCNLKNAIPRWVPNPDVISGIPPTDQVGVDRYGSDLRSFDVPSDQIEICQSECANDPHCAAYSYIGPNPQAGINAHCWLKSEVPTPILNSAAHSGIFRGFEANIDRLGNDYRAFDTRNPVTCRDTCQQESQCRAFTWTGAKCYLKHTASPPSPALGWISGMRRGLEVNVDRPGNDLRGIDLPFGTPEACQAECQKERRCAAFTYVPGLQANRPRCLLKSAVPQDAPREDIGIVSGVRGLDFF